MLLAPPGCDLGYPEVVVVNRMGEHVLIRDPSFGGCVWNAVLGHGDTTVTGRCLPGEDRVHFKKFDAEAYCRDQAEDGTLPGVCPCDGEPGEPDPALTNEVPAWFNYQTVSTRRADYGDFVVIEITADDIEQDFSVPGPYGH